MSANVVHTLPGKQKMEVIEGKLGEKLRKDFFMFQDGVMIDKENRWILPTNFLKFAKMISNFRFHSSDVLVLSFPRSGTILIQEIVWSLIHNPNMDNPDAKTAIDTRWFSFHGDMLIATTGAPPLSPEGFLVKKFKTLFPGKDTSEGVLLHLAATSKPPRLIKTHIPMCFFPPAFLDVCKVIYVAREPEDVINSLYFFMKLNVLYEYFGIRDDFVDYFINGKICFGPFWKHVKSGWQRRHHPNFLFLFYEDLLEDTEGEVRKIDKFLGTKRTNEQLRNIVKFTAFEALKQRSIKSPPSANELRYFNTKVLKECGGMFNECQSGNPEGWGLTFTPLEEDKIKQWRNRNLEDFEEDFRYKPS